MLGAPPPLISSASVFHRYPLCCSPVFLIPAAHHQRDRVIGSGRCTPRLGFVPRRAHPDVALLLRQQDDRHGLRVDRFDDGVRRRGPPVDLMRAWNWFGFRSALTLELGPDAGEAGQRPIVIDREPDDVLFFVSGFGSGAYSAKLFPPPPPPGFSQPRQCGDDVLLMLVTCGPPVRSGGGMPRRIIQLALDTVVADAWRGIIWNRPGIAGELTT